MNKLAVVVILLILVSCSKESFNNSSNHIKYKNGNEYAIWDIEKIYCSHQSGHFIECILITDSIKVHFDLFYHDGGNYSTTYYCGHDSLDKFSGKVESFYYDTYEMNDSIITVKKSVYSHFEMGILNYNRVGDNYTITFEADNYSGYFQGSNSF